MEASNVPRPRVNRFALVTLVALTVTVLAALADAPLRPSGLLRDFNAFYCAGRALGAGADPYLAEPLGACERLPKPAPLQPGVPGLAMPAPLPPYALVVFRPLAALPYPIAAVLWTFAGVGCLALTVWALRALTGLPVAGLVAALALTDGYASLCLGQVAPVAIAAIALAAYLLARKREAWAALAASAALIEPHLGLPLCASLFIFRPRTRGVLLGAAATCGALSLAAVGWAVTREYVTAVLPAHALSEVANEKQFSLTYALFRCGIAPELALRLGELSYLCATLLGFAAARRIAPRVGPAAYAVIPPALAVIGGPFVHVIQLSAALPALLVISAGSTCVPRRLAGAAIVALAIPWIQFANLGLVFIAFVAIVAAVLVHVFIDERPTASLAAATLAGGFVVLCSAAVGPIADAVPVLVAHYDPHALAETSWALYVQTIGTSNATAFDLAKLPSMFGLAVLARVAFLEATADGAHLGRLAIGGKEAAAARRTTG